MLLGSNLGPLLLILLCNDITDVIRHSQILKHADDTDISIPDKDVKVIQSQLSEDIWILYMDLILDWLKENERTIYMKEGKTEALLLGTPRRISMQSAYLKVYQGLNAIRNALLSILLLLGSLNQTARNEEESTEDVPRPMC